MWHRLRNEETGAQSLEFVALLPLVILVMLTILQVSFLGYAIVVAESSAREAALVASRDPSLSKSAVQQAARQVAGGLSVSVTSVQCSSGDVSVGLEAQVPNVLFDAAIKITRSVTMPTKDGRC